MEFQQPSFYIPMELSFPKSIDFSFCQPSTSSGAGPINPKSPIRQHGPTLLPKIRSQDLKISATPRAKSISLTATSDFRPSKRRHTEPQVLRDLPCFSMPMVPVIPFTEVKRASIAQIGNFEAYSLPECAPCVTDTEVPTFTSANYDLPLPELSELSVFPELPEFPEFPDLSELSELSELQKISCKIYPGNFLDPFYDGSSLLKYLSSPNPAPDLVRKIKFRQDMHAKYFWWDIRQIRPWQSFSIASISAAPGLFDLLCLNLPGSNFPTPPRTSLQPETELELADIYNSFYASKLNAALALSLGPRHLVMRQGRKGSSDPSFISSYNDEASSGIGRIVGLVKSFDRWNTGMRVEDNHRRVEYLRGLSHLHHLMREHKSRYGFILTEIEVVIVRNSDDLSPSFGYLEVEAIQLATSSDTKAVFPGDENPIEKRPKMTALLALWFIHMLARDDVFPGHIGWKSVVAPDDPAGRRKFLPKDQWIPEPQISEKRAAKRSRGWIWPRDAPQKKTGTRGGRQGRKKS